MSQSGQQSTNIMNAQQAQLNRDFQAAQAQKQMDFQERMSDTAMQRRVTDLKAAGINPMLAVGLGGAQAMPGAAGSGAQAQMQNPAGAFGNLGQQASSAMQAGANIEQAKAQASLASAQATKTEAEMNLKLPEEVKLLQSQTGLNARYAQQSWAQADYIYKQIINTDSDTALKNIQAQLQGTNSDILKATAKSLISAAQSDAAAKQYNLAGMSNLSAVESSTFGRVLAYINAALHPIGSAASAAGRFVP